MIKGLTQEPNSSSLVDLKVELTTFQSVGQCLNH